MGKRKLNIEGTELIPSLSLRFFDSATDRSNEELKSPFTENTDIWGEGLGSKLVTNG